jgi:hypothetical protein
MTETGSSTRCFGLHPTTIQVLVSLKQGEMPVHYFLNQ